LCLSLKNQTTFNQLGLEVVMDFYWMGIKK